MNRALISLILSVAALPASAVIVVPGHPVVIARPAPVVVRPSAPVRVAPSRVSPPVEPPSVRPLIVPTRPPCTEDRRERKEC